MALLNRPDVLNPDSGVVGTTLRTIPYGQTWIAVRRLAVVDSLAIRLLQLRTRFDRAHAEGLAALERGDYPTLRAAIKRERLVIEEYGQMLKALVVNARRRNPAK